MRQEQERACGGIGNACRLDQALAFQPIDIDRLDVPRLPTPPALEAVEDRLAALADELHAAHPAAADAALAALAKE